MPVEPDLARRLTAAAQKLEAWRERRDNLIREAFRAGGSLREIAALVGLSNPGVLGVIRRGGEAGTAQLITGVQANGQGDEDDVERLPPVGRERRLRGGET